MRPSSSAIRACFIPAGNIGVIPAFPSGKWLAIFSSEKRIEDDKLTNEFGCGGPRVPRLHETETHEKLRAPKTTNSGRYWHSFPGRRARAVDVFCRDWPQFVICDLSSPRAPVPGYHVC